MRGIRRWLTGTALLTGTAAWAQGPPGRSRRSPRPCRVAPWSGRTVPASPASPAAGGRGLDLRRRPLPPGAPIVPPPPAPDSKAGQRTGPGPECAARHADHDQRLARAGVPPAPASPAAIAAGRSGRTGRSAQEVYVRTGGQLPDGNGLLVRGLNIGYATTAGGRAQFFSPAGDTAWTVDLHAFYTYNDGGGQDIVTVRGEPVTVRALHRSGVGLGVGQDYFLAGPGFVGGLWDANLRYGWDVGGRWGAGHVDLNSAFVRALYRRHYDVFGQPFVGLNVRPSTSRWADTPGLFGGRVEWNYTFSDILPKQGSFQEVVAQLMFGVRY